MILGDSWLPYHFPNSGTSPHCLEPLELAFSTPPGGLSAVLCARRMVWAVPSSRTFCIHSKTDSYWASTTARRWERP